MNTPRSTLARSGDVVVVTLADSTSATVLKAMRAAFEHERGVSGVRFVILPARSEHGIAAADDLARIAQHWLTAHTWTSEQMLDAENLDGASLGRCRDLCVKLGAVEP